METGHFPIAPTADGSDTFFSETFGEWFHSRSGSYEEARSTYVQATKLVERAQQQGGITLLDVCYGLGYNTAAALEGIWAVQPETPIHLVGLELDESVPKAAIAQGLLHDWPLPVQAALAAIATHQRVVGGHPGPHPKSLSQNWERDLPQPSQNWERDLLRPPFTQSGARDSLRPPFSQFWEKGLGDEGKVLAATPFYPNRTHLTADLLIGDARQQIQTLVKSGFQADVIFLDPFSPPRCPQLWTVEFLGLVAQCLHPQGILATYSCAAAVRTALKLAGLHLGSLAAPGRRWPSTLASWTDIHLPPLSPQELEHLETRAAVPYRDPTRGDLAAAIHQRRAQEQAVSSLQSTGAWRRRWLCS